MSIIKQVEEKLKCLILELGYDVDNITVFPSARPDLGDYQLNEAMMLGKKNNKNPRIVAEEIVSKLNEQSMFTNINIAGPGFINFTLSNDFLVDCVNKLKDIKTNNIDYPEKKKILIDYGGANVAKELHVGHLR